MVRFLPPLNGLRAFEAAARHLSFAKAAAELNVTPAAVSHQIKALEARLGVKLFRRGTREVHLTEAGVAYLAGVREGFDRLAEATARLLAREAGGPLTVSLLPSFAARWLVPRLKSFREQHPDIDVRMSATQALADFTRDDVDVAIRFGRGAWPGLTAELLLADDLVPVCSPALLDGSKPLRTPDDLKHFTLLHDNMREDWGLWLRGAGIEGVDLNRGPSFNDSSLIIQAALDGVGVALASSAFVAAEIAAGRLVRLFAFALKEEQAHYLVYPPASAQRPKLQAFREWILAETRRERQPAG